MLGSLLRGAAFCIGRARRASLVLYYRLTLRSVGRKFRIGIRSTIVTPERVRIGANFFAGPDTYMSTSSFIDIGSNVMFGPAVMLLGGDHQTHLAGVPMRELPSGRAEPIIIEDDVWIGARSILLRGVRIGTGSVVAAGSVVTTDVPPFTISGGVPCRVIRVRQPENTARFAGHE